MAEFSNIEKRLARKDHKCNFCLQPIQKGTVYERQAGFDSGTAWTWKNHTRCSALANITGMYRDNIEEGLTTENFIECARLIYEKESGKDGCFAPIKEVVSYLYEKFNV